MSVLVELDNISKKIGNKTIIENVSFKICKGELTTLIGPNGAGKTTIARLILGLDSVSSGNITAISGLKISYVPQKLEINKILPITLQHFISLLSPDFQTNKIPYLLDFADFNRLKDVDISKLSGGQLQKILIITALINNPELLILDEPTLSLDVQSQQEFYRLLEKMKKEINLTIFMISHDLHTVMKNSEQVICLNSHICCSGRPNELAANTNFINTLSAIGFYTHDHDHRH